MIQKTTLRQQEIIEAARTIIFNQGIESLTVREIANELKITDGALYRHFKSKDEILSLLIEDIEETLLTTISEAAKKDGNPLIAMENVFLAHLHYAEKRKGITFIVMASLKDKKLQKKMFGVINKYLKVIKGILRQGVAEGKFRLDVNLDSASIAFFGMVQGLVSIWGLSRYRYALRKDRAMGMFNTYKLGIITN
ncbi:MAG: TetR/AcrR family transcriptional regulator [Candidatus Omnitrophica bacterium]|nr:TetR/AcrR family transcriptional regulator [Candidatus Omnitrophota bacterium]